MNLLLPALLFAGIVSTSQEPLPRIDRLAERVHRIELAGSFPANVTVLHGEDGCFLVDSGFEETRGDLQRALNRIGAGSVHTILHTHPHHDHVAGDAILAADGAVFVHAAASEYLEQHESAIPVAEAEAIELDDETIHLVPFSGGHSGNDVAIHFERAKVLCLGDLYLSESFPTVDLEAGGAASLIENLERVLEIFPADVRVVPGHGRITTMAELARYVERMKETIVIVRREVAAGKHRERIVSERPLRDFAVWARFFPFIDETTWVREIVESYGGAPLPPEELSGESTTPRDLPSPRFTILFNNLEGTRDGFGTAWGFSCLIEGYEKPLLFDTGLSGEMLLANMERAEIDPASIEHVLFTHAHGDHTGGFAAFAERQPGAAIYPLAAFPPSVNRALDAGAARSTPIELAREIFPGIHTSGAMGRQIPEQALFLETSDGLVILTGCAHPGIGEIVRRGKQMFGGRIRLVIGGFHLPAHSEDEIRAIIAEMKEIGVEQVAPTHCTGDAGFALFREAWGDDYLDAGCGNVLEL